MNGKIYNELKVSGLKGLRLSLCSYVDQSWMENARSMRSRGGCERNKAILASKQDL